MFDRATVIDIIDRAYEAQRFCDACGTPTVLRTRGHTVVVECPAVPGEGIVARIGSFLIPHTRRVALDLDEDLAA